MVIDYGALAAQYTQTWMARSAEIAGSEYNPAIGAFAGIPLVAGAETPEPGPAMVPPANGALQGYKLNQAAIAAMNERIAGLSAGQEEVLGAIEAIQWPAATPAAPVVATQMALNGGVSDITATPAAFPLLGLGAIAGYLSLGALKGLLRTLGPKILKALIGVMAFKEFMDMLGIGAPDETQIKIRKAGAGRRYSIGSNPRVRTLQKVSRHCKRLLTKHEKVIREFLPKKQPRYGIPPAKALSAIERAAIRGT